MEVKALQQMLSQFRQVQEKLEKQIDELSVEASTGGGMVTVKMNGQKQLTEVRIEPDVFKEMLQDLIQGAVNEATRRVDEELSKQVKEISGGLPGVAGLKIPGLF
jgi:DNA-binding YbaB/EbfC family protein